MTFETINALSGWCLNTGIDDRYCKGTWAVLVPSWRTAHHIIDTSGAGEPQMMPMVEYLESMPWFPYAFGSDILTAMESLEAKLSRLGIKDQGNIDESWEAAVYEACDVLDDWYHNEQNNFKPIVPAVSWKKVVL